MAKRKKYPRLPNGYGQIRYLGKGRRNPYGVYPPSEEEYDNGQKKSPTAIRIQLSSVRSSFPEHLRLTAAVQKTDLGLSTSEQSSSFPDSNRSLLVR